MATYYADDTTTIHHGDSLHILWTLPDNSVDAVCTDPPYGLEFMGKDWDKFKGAARIRKPSARDETPGAGHNGSTFLVRRNMPDAYVAGSAFQQWCEVWAAECLRILKPGGHMLAFGGTRTFHRLACAVEDAGFEIRDSIAWLYGSGFPKSLDVSKAIDRQRTEDLEPQAAVARWLVDRMAERGITRRNVSDHFDAANAAQQWTTYWTDGAVKPRVPTVEQWAELRVWLGLPDDMDAEVWRLNGRKGKPGDNFESREVLSEQVTEVKGGSWATMVNSGRFRIGERVIQETSPATPEAQQWQGWGTALKPAFEPIIVARKPLTGTVAGNVLQWGTGALNVDGCRIPADWDTDPTRRGWQGGNSKTVGVTGNFGMTGDRVAQPNTGGRWPANVILDETAARELDQQSGELAPPGHSATDLGGGIWGNGGPRTLGQTYNDFGGASRFMYTAKADSSERVSYWRLSCNCETVKPWPDTSPQKATDDSESATEASWNTSTSGNNTTGEKSQSDTMFTTETATNSTTTGPTSNSSPNSTTNASTPTANSETANGGSPAASVKSSNRSPLNTGTSAPKAGPSTDDAAPVTLRGLSATDVCESCGAPTKLESHATVKPLDLMRWLVRLVCAPGGLILDPFAGSGTTVEAALLEGFRCTAIEREQDYLPLITQRIHRRRDPVQYLTAAGEDLGLFGDEE